MTIDVASFVALLIVVFLLGMMCGMIAMMTASK